MAYQEGRSLIERTQRIIERWRLILLHHCRRRGRRALLSRVSGSGGIFRLRLALLLLPIKPLGGELALVLLEGILLEYFAFTISHFQHEHWIDAQTQAGKERIELGELK